jgi:hypothetical protein
MGAIPPGQAPQHPGRRRAAQAAAALWGYPGGMYRGDRRAGGSDTDTSRLTDQFEPLP